MMIMMMMVMTMIVRIMMMKIQESKGVWKIRGNAEVAGRHQHLLQKVSKKFIEGLEKIGRQMGHNMRQYGIGRQYDT